LIGIDVVDGSSDGGVTVHDDNTVLSDKMKQAAQILNLKGHVIGQKDAKTLYSAGDMEGHLGTDHRMYVIDFAR
jgi:hypothetical protein